MDCIISGNSNVKRFSYAISCLCRIGKDLYIDFNELDGLYLKTLNDAKSAYTCCHFQPSFFERCCSPPTGALTKGATSTSRSRGRDRMPTGPNSSRKRRNIGGDKATAADVEDGDIPSQQTYSLTCRVPLRTLTSALRPRKNVRSLRIRSHGNSEQHSVADGNDSEEEPLSATTENDGSREGKLMQLSFEYILESQQHANSMMRVAHRVGVAECDSIMAVVSSTIREQHNSYSEIVSSPKLFTKILDPLRKTAEIVFTVNDEKKQITVASFHDSDIIATARTGNNSDTNLLLLPSSMLLKTQTSMGCDEFECYTWRNSEHFDNSRLQSNSAEGSTNREEPPSNVHEEVNLVFGIREIKTLVQFCTSVNMQDHDMKIVMSFQYGGKPIVFESSGKGFTIQLIMATLDHKLLRPNM